MVPGAGRTLYRARFLCSPSDAIPSVTLPWKSPKYSDKKLEEWWKEKDSLLTVGKAGLTPTLINGVREMMTYHWRLKLKVAHDKYDAWAIANKVVDDESMRGNIEILEVRPKMILFGQKSACEDFANSY